MAGLDQRTGSRSENALAHLEHRADIGNGQSIDVVAASCLHFDQSALEQAAEVVRRVGRAQCAGARQLAGRARTIAQAQEQAETGAVGQSTKELRVCVDGDPAFHGWLHRRPYCFIHR